MNYLIGLGANRNKFSKTGNPTLHVLQTVSNVYGKGLHYPTRKYDFKI